VASFHWDVCVFVQVLNMLYLLCFNCIVLLVKIDISNENNNNNNNSK